MRNLTHRWPQSGHFCRKLGHFFQFLKIRAGETSPPSPPSYAPVNCRKMSETADSPVIAGIKLFRKAFSKIFMYISLMYIRDGSIKEWKFTFEAMISSFFRVSTIILCIFLYSWLPTTAHRCISPDDAILMLVLKTVKFRQSFFSTRGS